MPAAFKELRLTTNANPFDLPPSLLRWGIKRTWFASFVKEIAQATYVSNPHDVFFESQDWVPHQRHYAEPNTQLPHSCKPGSQLKKPPQEIVYSVPVEAAGDCTMPRPQGYYSPLHTSRSYGFEFQWGHTTELYSISLSVTYTGMLFLVFQG